jgi:hypothetical protein
MDPTEVILIQDTREQCGYQDLFEAPCVVDTLACGDYSVVGMTHLAAIERKSLSDLLNSLTHERERFERELARARAYQKFFVIVEASGPDVLAGNFGRSQANPKSIWETICCFSIRYAPFVFAGDRFTGARLTESLLLKFAREYTVTLERMERACKAVMIGNEQRERTSATAGR